MPMETSGLVGTIAGIAELARSVRPAAGGMSARRWAASPWWAWIVLAGVLALAEMAVPGAYLMWIALGAAVTAVAAGATGMILEGQLAVFAIATAVSCLGGYFVYRALVPRWIATAASRSTRRSAR